MDELSREEAIEEIEELFSKAALQAAGFMDYAVEASPRELAEFAFDIARRTS